MKQIPAADPRRKGPVAPFTGAWIETDVVKRLDHRHLVAPFTGAWIETRRSSRTPRRNKSHPSRVRGLKLVTGNGWKMC